MTLFDTHTSLPAVVVPVQGDDLAAVLAHARAVAASGADVAEWRLDAWGRHDAAGAVAALGSLRTALGGLPVLATFRSLAEGGPGTLSDEDYTALLLALLADGVEGVDVELTRPAPVARAVLEAAGASGAAVVGSSHDFERTPGPEELDRLFDGLADRGSDVLKVAVQVHDDGDVFRLLAAAHRARRHGTAVLPIAMGATGVLTRFAGEAWGAPATFARVGVGSAPGQLGVTELRAALTAVHGALAAASS